MVAAVDGEKQRLRVAMRAKRAELTRAGQAAAAAALVAHAAAVLGSRRTCSLAGYWPIQPELDPRPLMGCCRDAGAGLALPVMVAKAMPLLFRSWAPGDAMLDRVWGIREPIASAPEVAPDVLLVPLLAVDRAGWRLGYGAGFYDRTLAALRGAKPILAIGIAFEEQVIDAVPHSVYDQRLDWVLTPSGPFACRES